MYILHIWYDFLHGETSENNYNSNMQDKERRAILTPWLGFLYKNCYKLNAHVKKLRGKNKVAMYLFSIK